MTARFDSTATVTCRLVRWRKPTRLRRPAALASCCTARPSRSARATCCSTAWPSLSGWHAGHRRRRMRRQDRRPARCRRLGQPGHHRRPTARPARPDRLLAHTPRHRRRRLRPRCQRRGQVRHDLAAGRAPTARRPPPLPVASAAQAAVADAVARSVSCSRTAPACDTRPRPSADTVTLLLRALFCIGKVPSAGDGQDLRQAAVLPGHKVLFHFKSLARLISGENRG